MEFDRFAHSYESNAFIQRDLIQWAEPYINEVSLKNSSIIEFGAGTGLLTRRLLKENPLRIVATDNAPSMISEAKNMIPQIDWKLMDAWNTKSKSFDHVFSSSLLQWCQTPAQTILNWSEDLPKGGTIHSLFFIDQTLTELRQLIDLKNTPQWKTQKTWESFFKRAGLNILLSREEIKTYNFQNSLKLLKTLKNTGTSLKNQHCGSKLKEILKNYDKQYSCTDGIISTWHFCQIIAQK